MLERNGTDFPPGEAVQGCGFEGFEELLRKDVERVTKRLVVSCKFPANLNRIQTIFEFEKICVAFHKQHPLKSLILFIS